MILYGMTGYYDSFHPMYISHKDIDFVLLCYCSRITSNWFIKSRPWLYKLFAKGITPHLHLDGA